MNSYVFTATLGSEVVTIETGKLAQQAGGAVTVRCGDTVLLVTATMSRATREGIGFFPLTVDFEERLYAAGRIPGSFFRREGRPTESATLTTRLTDRPIRPLFPKDLRNDVQIIITPLSQDEERQADILSIIGASAALTISDIPFGGPVGATRVGYIDGELVVEPTVSQMEHSALDLRLAGSSDAILMVEAGANEVSEDVMVEALRLGHEAIQGVIRVQNEMRETVGKPKRDYTPHALPNELREIVRQQVGDRMPDAIYGATSKVDLNERMRVLRDELNENLGEEWEESAIRQAFEDVEREIVRRRTIVEGVRADGRAPQTIRPLSAEVGLLPRRTAPASSPVARPRYSPLPPWARPAKSRCWTTFRRRRPSVTYTITISRPTPPERHVRCVAPDGARSVTEPWLSGRCCRCSLTMVIFPTPCASSARRSAPMGPPRWRACAGAPCR